MERAFNKTYPSVERKCTTKRLRWSSGQHAGLWYPSSRVRIRPKPLDFSGVRTNLSKPSFEGEVKESVPCPVLSHVKEASTFVNSGFAS